MKHDSAGTFREAVVGEVDCHDVYPAEFTFRLHLTFYLTHLSK